MDAVTDNHEHVWVYQPQASPSVYFSRYRCSCGTWGYCHHTKKRRNAIRAYVGDTSELDRAGKDVTQPLGRSRAYTPGLYNEDES